MLPNSQPESAGLQPQQRFKIEELSGKDQVIVFLAANGWRKKDIASLMRVTRQNVQYILRTKDPDGKLRQSAKETEGLTKYLSGVAASMMMSVGYSANPMSMKPEERRKMAWQLISTARQIKGIAGIGKDNEGDRPIQETKETDDVTAVLEALKNRTNPSTC
jgi:hypothetical protein